MWCRVVYSPDYGQVTADCNLNVRRHVRHTAFKADSDVLRANKCSLHTNKQGRQCKYKLNIEARSLTIVALEKLSVCL
jgi:hypothetical protein